MDMKQQNEMNPVPLEQQLDTQPAQKPAEPDTGEEYAQKQPVSPNERAQPAVPMENNRTLGVGEWMITLLVFLLPIVNIIMMAVWAFSSKGNVHRKNFARACLLWLIILLIGYAVAMTVAGYTIFDIFTDRL